MVMFAGGGPGGDTGGGTGSGTGGGGNIIDDGDRPPDCVPVAYTIVQGDTLTTIAAAHAAQGVDFRQICAGRKASPRQDNTHVLPFLQAENAFPYQTMPSPLLPANLQVEKLPSQIRHSPPPPLLQAENAFPSQMRLHLSAGCTLVSSK